MSGVSSFKENMDQVYLVRDRFIMAREKKNTAMVYNVF